MEYAEYKGVDSVVDYAGLTDKLATKVSDIGKERARTKEELDQIASDASRGFSEMEMTKTESLNDKLLTLGNEGREKVNNWNAELKAGRLSPSEYKKRMSGLTEYTSLVGSTAKTFDTRIQEHIKRQADGTGSAFELETLDRFGMMADLKNTDYKVLDDGRIAIDIKDPKTGKVIRQEDLRVINQPENMVTPKLNLAKEVNSVVKNWAADGIVKLLGQGGYENSASAMNDPKYKLDKQRLVDQLVTQNAISLLVDNGGLTTINYAYSDADKKTKLSEAIAKEQEFRKRAGQETELTADEISELETGIIIVDNNGKPKLTDDQIDKAREAADREIDLQVGNELKSVAPQNWYGKSSKSDYSTAIKKLTNTEGYNLSLDAMNANVGETTSDNTNLARLSERSRAAGSPMYFKKVKLSDGTFAIEGTSIVKDEMGQEVLSTKPEDIKIYDTAQSLSGFIWYQDPAKSSAFWADGKGTLGGQEHLKKVQEGWNKDKSKPKAQTTAPKVVVTSSEGWNEYTYSGDTYSENEMKKAAKSSGMSLDEYIKMLNN